jgi:flagellin-like protein
MLGKRGISEIVAALILVSIAVAASVIIYIYSSGLLGSLQAAQPQQGQYANQLTLEFYDWTASGTGDATMHTVRITLRNVGSGLANLAAIYVAGNPATLKSGTSWTCIVSTTTVTTTTVSRMVPGSSCTALLTVSTPTITLGTAYVVRIVTRDGGVFSYSCIAGRSTGSLS